MPPMPMGIAGASPAVSPQTLKQWLHDGDELALLDVREHGQFGESHLFHAVPLPYSRLELEIGRLVPRRATRTVLCDDGASGVAVRAARRLAALGYGAVHVLDGGTAGWARAGFVLFQGVNLPSKTFGELVEHSLHTPRIGAIELARRQAAGDDLVVLDGRPYNEFAKMSIPGAVCCPNGELALRIGQLAPSPRTTIVVNCAGRTRSIIGAQTLIDFGVPNPVFALENGTQGWTLSDLPLDHGRTARHGDASPADLSERRAQAARLAVRHGVVTIDAAQLHSWLADESRNTYVLDVRTPSEYAERTLPGAQHAPGGQLLQATDQYVGVRGARLVLVDSDGVRAPVVASWLRRLGHEACVLAGGIDAAAIVLPPAAPPLSALAEIGAQALARELAAGTVAAFDLRSGMDFRRAHAPGSTWSIRPRLVADVQAAGRPAVLIAAPEVAQLAAVDLAEAGLDDVRLLHGGLAAWQGEALPVASSPECPSDADCIDYLFFVHDRHDGNKDAARRYLAWETGLIGQLDDAERASFRITAAA